MRWTCEHRHHNTTLTQELSHTCTLAETCVHEHAPTHTLTLTHTLTNMSSLAGTHMHTDTRLYTHTHKLHRDLHLICDEFGVFFIFYEYRLQN